MDEKAAGALGGAEAGRFFLEQFPGEDAKIAVIEVVGQEASTNRSDGFIEGFRESVPEAEVVVRVNGEGLKDKAADVTEDIIQSHPEINVLFGANGDQGLGALAALESAGRGALETELVASHDGSEPEVLKIADPESALKIANANRPKECAQACIDTLLEMISGERDMKDTDTVTVESGVISAGDLQAAQTFMQEQYLSDVVLVQ